MDHDEHKQRQAEQQAPRRLSPPRIFCSRFTLTVWFGLAASSPKL